MHHDPSVTPAPAPPDWPANFGEYYSPCEYVGRCSCGWRSTVCNSIDQARTRVEMHLERIIGA